MAQTKNPTTEIYDLVVIGGGINGAAVARDAAGRGLKVALFERDDYAGQTSSASSKLIHGGLRYLENYEFSLVRSSLRERDVVMSIAPHLVEEIRFLVPLYQGSKRPAWFMRIGLFLYDFLAASRNIAKSGALSAKDVESVPHLRKSDLKSVLYYSDCQVDDARLVISTLLDARARGADIRNYHEVTQIKPLENGYCLNVKSAGTETEINARFVVNTAGPFANEILARTKADLPRMGLRLVRGSHLLFRMPEPAFTTAFTLQNDDGRVVFVIPWQRGRYFMLGTTDAPESGDPASPVCSNEERDYLLDVYNRYFTYNGQKAGPDDIIWTWAGVRPLVDDGSKDPSKVTRDVRLLGEKQGSGGFLTVYGGKLTTHRKLGEKVMRKLQSLGLNAGQAWTANEPVAGGDFSIGALEQLVANAPAKISPVNRQRLVSTYGSGAETMFDAARNNPQEAAEIAPGIHEFELRHAVEVEDARSAKDFLYRRTKLFLELSSNDRKKIEAWFAKNA